MRVGVLALQGGFALHLDALARLGVDAIELRAAGQVEALDGLVLPGGESGAMLRLLDRPLEDALRRHAAAGKPTLATCAGLILAASEVRPAQPSFGWLDVTVARNGWGRQVHSAERRADDGRPITLIRAPRVTRVGARVSVELTLDGEPVLVRAGTIWGATFHPELDDEPWLHRRVFAAPDYSGSIGSTARSSASQRSRHRARE